MKLMAMVGCCLFAAVAGAGELDGWSRKVELTLGADLAPTEITTGVPTLVRLSEAKISGFKYDGFASSVGADLIFTCNGKIVPHEVDEWNPSGESLVWVRLPSTAQGTTLTMYYGRETAPTDRSAAVWEGYAGVWHLNEDSVGRHNLTVRDSTVNHYDGTAYTGSHDGQTVAGKLGNGWQISTASGNSQTGGIIMESMANAMLGTSFTISGWLYHGTGTCYYDHLFYRKNGMNETGGFASQIKTGSAWSEILSVCGNSTSSQDLNMTNAIAGGWGHLSLTYHDGKAYIVNNGVPGDAKNVSAPTDNSKAIAFGNNYSHNNAAWVGSMDELRIRIGAYDANYAAAEYRAMNVGETDLFGFGTAQPVSSETVTVNFSCDESRQSYVARTDVSEISSGATVWLNALVTVTVTPVFGRTYFTVPEGWMRQGRSIVKTVSASSDPTEIAIPDAEVNDDLVGWRKKVDLSLSCDLAESEIKDGLPALVRLSEAGISGFLYAEFMRHDGLDLVFVVDGQRIPHEVDTWNPSGESLVWVRLPSTAQGTTLTMYYGREAAASDQSAAVWSNYVGVWHLGENSDGAKDMEIHDASANGYDGTAYTGSGSGQTVAGKFGNGWRISSQTGNKGGGILLTSLAEVSLGKSFTVSGWMYHAKDTYAWDRIICRKDAQGGGFYTMFNDNKWGNIAVCGSTTKGGNTTLTNAVNGGWAHIAFSYDNTAARLINNGVPTSAFTVDAPTDNGKPVSFGIESDRGQATWNGVMDELRIRKGEYDANYLAAEYAAMNDGEADIFAFGKPTSASTEKVTVNFINNASKQKFVAMSDGERVTSGGSVWSNAMVVVTVTPGKSYAYPTAPDGWTKQGATIVRIVAAATDPTMVVIPDAEINPDFVGWKKKVTVSLAAALADTEITEGLPTLVRLSEETVEGFRYADFKRDDGADLVFIAGGLRLPHEVDTWNPGGESLVWVRLPSTAQGTSFTMCYGRAEASTDMSAAVWEGYAGVWHLNENSNGTHDTTVHDSTANGYDGTAYTGNASAKGQTVQGKLGSGWQISSSTGKQGGGIIMESMTNATLGTAFTVSGWYWHKADVANYDHFIYRKNAIGDGNGFASEINAASWSGNIKVCGASISYTTFGLTNAVNGGWAHIAVALEGPAARIVNNGVASDSQTGISAPTDNGKAIAFGVDSDKSDANWCGMMDELRIRKGAFDANFAAAEYKAMNVGADDIFAFGKAEEFTPGLILFLR